MILTGSVLDEDDIYYPQRLLEEWLYDFAWIDIINDVL